MLRHFVEFVRTSDVEKVGKLLNKGLDPNFMWKEGEETPLTLAVQLENPREMIMTLVSGGAHLDYRTMDSLTPLHRAACKSKHEAIKTLLDLGQSPNTYDCNDLTPLYHAVVNNAANSCISSLLFDHAKLGTRDEAGLQEIHQACRFGRIQHLDTLILYGADLDGVTLKNGNSPLHICAMTNQPECARMLLFRGAKRDLVNRVNRTARDEARLIGNAQVARIIDTFQPEDAVPVRRAPQLNQHRRPLTSSQSSRQRQRCISMGRLNDLCNDSPVSNPPDDVTTYRFDHQSDRGVVSSQNGGGSTVLKHSRSLANGNKLLASSASGYCLNTIGDCDSLDADPPYPNYSATMRPTKSTTNKNPSFELGQSASVAVGRSGQHVYSPPQYRRQNDIGQQPSRSQGQYQNADNNRHLIGQSRTSLESMWALPSPPIPPPPPLSINCDTTRLPGSAFRGVGTAASATMKATPPPPSPLPPPPPQELTNGFPSSTSLSSYSSVNSSRGSVGRKFVPTPECPALQVIEKIDPKSAAYHAGMKRGDFVLEVNGINVTTMPHEQMVNLIRNTGQILSLKLLTINRGQDNSSELSSTNTLSTLCDTNNQSVTPQSSSIVYHHQQHINPSSTGYGTLGRLDKNNNHHHTRLPPSDPTTSGYRFPPPPAPPTTTSSSDHGIATALIDSESSTNYYASADADVDSSGNSTPVGAVDYQSSHYRTNNNPKPSSDPSIINYYCPVSSNQASRPNIGSPSTSNSYVNQQHKSKTPALIHPPAPPPPNQSASCLVAHDDDNELPSSCHSPLLPPPPPPPVETSVPPPPPPPPINNPIGRKQSSPVSTNEFALSLQRAANKLKQVKVTDQSPSKSNSTTVNSNFTENLRQAIALRRQKIEMLSSSGEEEEEEEESYDNVPTTSVRPDNRQISSTNNHHQHPPVVAANKPKITFKQPPPLLTVRTNSLTTASSIPPPDKFKDSSRPINERNAGANLQEACRRKPTMMEYADAKRLTTNGGSSNGGINGISTLPSHNNSISYYRRK